MSGLLIPSIGYKPFRYPWAYDFWLAQQKMHWLHSEIPLGDDIKDWNTKLNENEREFLTQIFRFFTQADIDVHKHYALNLHKIFKPIEIRMAISAIENMETIHIAAYSHLIETIGIPDKEYSAFLSFEEMKNKHEFNQSFSMDSEEEILVTLAGYHAFNEGLQLFASFVMILLFPHSGLMNGAGQLVTLSVRDESLHCKFMIKLFHEFAKETRAFTSKVEKKIYEILNQILKLEDAFIDLVFANFGKIRNIEKENIRTYIRFVADQRLVELKMKPIFNIKNNPLPWLTTLLNGVEHSNFFEVKSTEYNKNSSEGEWGDVWN